MLNTPEAFFYIKFIPIYWSKEKYLQLEQNLSQQMNNEGLFQFHYDNDDQNSIENILPPEFKRRKGPTANNRIKSSVEDNKRKTAESKTLK
ncbi:12068_t:CDS:2 [Funneliformis mosseae]|uniref:12068_t:CDS:1 n=1 Tax=Funneliformis mosseae TaxID=27381 RepID=A0A9N9GRD1_FUNMO|nr:12068_t:CDS:2 [Funneliformis mosseae]